MMLLAIKLLSAHLFMLNVRLWKEDCCGQNSQIFQPFIGFEALIRWVVIFMRCLPLLSDEMRKGLVEGN